MLPDIDGEPGYFDKTGVYIVGNPCFAGWAIENFETELNALIEAGAGLQ